METSTNRGTGAGGANTNKNGKQFEEKTANHDRLLGTRFECKKIPGARAKKNNTYLEKKVDDSTTISFFEQGALKEYMRYAFS